MGAAGPCRFEEWCASLPQVGPQEWADAGGVPDSNEASGDSAHENCHATSPKALFADASTRASAVKGRGKGSAGRFAGRGKAKGRTGRQPCLSHLLDINSQAQVQAGVVIVTQSHGSHIDLLNGYNSIATVSSVPSRVQQWLRAILPLPRLRWLVSVHT